MVRLCKVVTPGDGRIDLFLTNTPGPPSQELILDQEPFSIVSLHDVTSASTLT